MSHEETMVFPVMNAYVQSVLIIITLQQWLSNCFCLAPFWKQRSIHAPQPPHFSLFSL